MAILVDTNILLRWRDPNDPDHPAWRAAMTPQVVTQQDLQLCAQVLIEYWVVATRPAANNGFGLTAATAGAELRALRTIVPVRQEPPDIASRWMSIVV